MGAMGTHLKDALPYIGGKKTLPMNILHIEAKTQRKSRERQET